MTTDSPKPGLRDRKRAETRARIEAAAIDLVLRDGLDAATVDAISERADVSPRTFFNYFESKDAAILGVVPSELDDQVLEDQLASAGETEPVLAVVRLVMATVGAVDRANPALHRRRIEVVRQHPEILGGQFAQLNARKDRLTEYAGRILALHPRFEQDPDAPVRAGIVLALCGSAVRAAVEDWAHGTEARTGANTETDEVAAIEARATALVHDTLGRLA